MDDEDEMAAFLLFKKERERLKREHEEMKLRRSMLNIEGFRTKVREEFGNSFSQEELLKFHTHFCDILKNMNIKDDCELKERLTEVLLECERIDVHPNLYKIIRRSYPILFKDLIPLWGFICKVMSPDCIIPSCAECLTSFLSSCWVKIENKETKELSLSSFRDILSFLTSNRDIPPLTLCDKCLQSQPQSQVLPIDEAWLNTLKLTLRSLGSPVHDATTHFVLDKDISENLEGYHTHSQITLQKYNILRTSSGALRRALCRNYAAELRLSAEMLVDSLENFENYMKIFRKISLSFCILSIIKQKYSFQDLQYAVKYMKIPPKQSNVSLEQIEQRNDWVRRVAKYFWETNFRNYYVDVKWNAIEWHDSVMKDILFFETGGPSLTSHSEVIFNGSENLLTLPDAPRLVSSLSDSQSDDTDQNQKNLKKFLITFNEDAIRPIWNFPFPYNFSLCMLGSTHAGKSFLLRWILSKMCPSVLSDLPVTGKKGTVGQLAIGTTKNVSIFGTPEYGYFMDVEGFIRETSDPRDLELWNLHKICYGISDIVCAVTDQDFANGNFLWLQKLSEAADDVTTNIPPTLVVFINEIKDPLLYKDCDSRKDSWQKV
jgi:hypothetical protein